MNVIVEHMRRNRLSVWVAAIYLSLALGFAGVHSHQDDGDTVDPTHNCVACLVVSDLDAADVPASLSISGVPQKQVVLPEPRLALLSFELVEAKARAPPLNS